MASILDFLDSPAGGNGLLDWLRGNANAAPANTPIGAPGDQASYNFPTIDPATGNTIAPPPAVTAAPMPPVQPMPQAQATAPAVQPSGPLSAINILSRLGQGLISYGHGGNFVPGFNGQPDDAAHLALRQKQQAIQQNYQAFVANGLSPQEATLAAINPEAAKAIIAKRFPADQKDKFTVVKTGQDAMGRETYGNLNQSTGEITPIKGPASDAGDFGQGLPGDTTKSGADYIASLPAEFQAPVAGLVNGTYKMPAFRSAKSAAYTNTLFAMAKQADPTFDSTTYGARQAGMKSFKSGADAGTVRSANQVLGHISDLTDKADALGNSSFTPYNYVKNEAASLTGSDAPGNWVTQAHAVADEMSSFMKGAGRSSDTEIQQWKDSLSPNMSPQQQRGAVQTLLGIYDHSLQALEDKRTGAIGPVASAKLGPLLTPAGQSAMDKIRKWASSSPAGAAVPSQAAIDAELARRGVK